MDSIRTTHQLLQLMLSTIEKKLLGKVLISIIIWPKRVSKSFIAKSHQAINADTYIETLRRHLVLFINKHHKNGNYLFWHDLASSHYADNVIKYLEPNNVNYVPKERNQLTLLQARPIEDFWSELKVSTWFASTLEAYRVLPYQNRPGNYSLGTFFKNIFVLQIV